MGCKNSLLLDTNIRLTTFVGYFMRVFLLLLLAVSLPSIANELSVLSPDKKVKLSFTDDGELAQYRVSFNGEPVLGLGKLGFTFAKAAPLYRDFKTRRDKQEYGGSNMAAAVGRAAKHSRQPQ